MHTNPHTRRAENDSMVRLARDLVNLAVRPLEFGDFLRAVLELLYGALKIDRGFVYLPSSPDGRDVYVSVGIDPKTSDEEQALLRGYLQSLQTSFNGPDARQLDTRLLYTLSRVTGERFGMPVIYFPIRSTQTEGVSGLVAIFTRTPNAFSQEQIMAIETAASAISLKMDKWFYAHSLEHSQAAIAAAKQEWERTVDMLPELILVTDPGGRVLRSNRTLEAWSSADIKDIRGWNCHELLHPGCRDAECRLKQAFGEGCGAVHERGVWEGELEDPVLGRFLKVHIRRLHQDEPEALDEGQAYSAIVLEDISGFKEMERFREAYNRELQQQVEAATRLLNQTNEDLKHQIQAHIRDKQSLRESEARYATLSNITQTGIYIAVDSRIVFCNQRLADIFRTGRERLKGSPLSEFMEQRKLPGPPGRRVPGGAMCGPTLVKGRAADGGELWLNQSAAPIMFMGRSAVLGNVVDETDLVQIQQSLEESRQKLKHLYREYLDVQEKERHRIASDLHDGIGQTLSGIKLSLENILDGCDRLQGEDRSRLNGILGKLQAGIEEVRRTAMNLRPTTLDHFGIIATIDWFCREFAREASQIQLEVDIEVSEEQVPEEVKVSIFRVIQESFNNVVRHARASTISLSLYILEGHLVLLVCDDGVGMDLQASGGRYNSLGLVSMRERVEYTHGSFVLDSAPGRGTRIKVEWPL